MFSVQGSSSQSLQQLGPVPGVFLPAPEHVLPCKRELVLTVRDEDSAKERSLFFLPAGVGMTAAVEHCRERAEQATVPLPASASAVWSSDNCLFLSAPYSIILFSFLLSQRLYAVLRPPGGIAVPRDPEENMNIPYYGVKTHQKDVHTILTCDSLIIDYLSC